MPRSYRPAIFWLLLAVALPVCPSTAAFAWHSIRPPTKLTADSPRYPSSISCSRGSTHRFADRRRDQRINSDLMKSSPSKAAPSAFCKFSPLLFGFLPVLAPAAASFTPTPAHAVSAPVAVSFSIISTKGLTALVAATDMVLKEDEMKADGEEVQRLMGRVEPIDRLGQEAEGIFKRARIAEADNEFEKALRLYDRVTRVAPGYAYAWSNKGNAYIALGDLEKGLDSYSRAVELLPSKTGDAWLVYLNKATTELALDRLDAAIQDLDLARVLRGQPDMLLFANKGLALERKGDLAQALENYEFAVLTKPKDVQPWWLRYSMVLFQEQQDIKAMEVMRKVVGKFGRVEETKVALATLVYAYGDKNEAERMWSELSGQTQYKYRDEDFLRSKLRWPSRMISTLRDFKGLYTPRA